LNVLKYWWSNQVFVSAVPFQEMRHSFYVMGIVKMWLQYPYGELEAVEEF